VPALEYLLDELAANAMPATTTQFAGGWVLRAAPSRPFRRCNSVLTTGAAETTDPSDDRRFALVEAFYGSHAMPARYQVSPASRPHDLDDQLAARGYEVEAPVDILVTDVHALRTTSTPACSIATGPAIDGAWASEYCATFDDSTTRRRVEAYREALRAVTAHVVFATADVSGVAAGMAIGVVERGWLGVFGMGTRPDVRRRGIASALLGALASAAREHGATRCYLQVEVDNQPARRLYEHAGFARAYGYHYRLRQLTQA
jgi:GNAT superfamily N-acetyltransferase